MKQPRVFTNDPRFSSRFEGLKPEQIALLLTADAVALSEKIGDGVRVHLVKAQYIAAERKLDLQTMSFYADETVRRGHKNTAIVWEEQCVRLGKSASRLRTLLIQQERPERIESLCGHITRTEWRQIGQWYVRHDRHAAAIKAFKYARQRSAISSVLRAALCSDEMEVAEQALEALSRKRFSKTEGNIYVRERLANKRLSTQDVLDVISIVDRHRLKTFRSKIISYLIEHNFTFAYINKIASNWNIPLTYTQLIAIERKHSRVIKRTDSDKELYEALLQHDPARWTDKYQSAIRIQKIGKIAEGLAKKADEIGQACGQPLSVADALSIAENLMSVAHQHGGRFTLYHSQELDDAIDIATTRVGEALMKERPAQRVS